MEMRLYIRYVWINNSLLKRPEVRINIYLTLQKRKFLISLFLHRRQKEVF
jgi:hypothetical protein